MVDYKDIIKFYKNKKVFITGHTGFKGSWMCQILSIAGADVTGYSMEPPTSPSLFDLCGISKQVRSIKGDIRDLDKLMKAVAGVKPEILIHMAAQPIVRESYKDPVGTYETNVMGTVNVCEVVRQNVCIKSFVNVTTDKVYFNREWEWGYRENEELNGYDPYSNSKSCSELVTSSYIKSFFDKETVSVSTCRAGNVIGGGDFALDRIIPDCIRAARDGNDIIVRNPHSIRPYQHVLEPLMVYLMIAAKQYEDGQFAGCYNVGPDEKDCRTTGELATLFCDLWNNLIGDSIKWINRYDGGPYESNFLELDCSKLKHTFGWQPRWGVDDAIKETINWSKVWMEYGTIDAIRNNMEATIKDFMS